MSPRSPGRLGSSLKTRRPPQALSGWQCSSGLWFSLWADSLRETGEFLLCGDFDPHSEQRTCSFLADPRGPLGKSVPPCVLTGELCLNGCHPSRNGHHGPCHCPGIHQPS